MTTAIVIASASHYLFLVFFPSKTKTYLLLLWVHFGLSALATLIPPVVPSATVKAIGIVTGTLSVGGESVSILHGVDPTPKARYIRVRRPLPVGNLREVG